MQRDEPRPCIEIADATDSGFPIPALHGQNDRAIATYRKVTGGFRSDWGPDLFAAVRSVIGTAARRGIDAYQAIVAVLQGGTVLTPG